MYPDEQSHLPDANQVWDEYQRMMDPPLPNGLAGIRPDVAEAIKNQAARDYPTLRGFPDDAGPVLDFSHEVAAQTAANDYKADAGRAPVMDAVFIPFGRTLLAIAEMMERQKFRHKLQGATDPFQEWRKLPEGKSRLANAGGRHALDPWTPNAKDRVGDHPGDLHILHAIWGLMAAYELHLQEENHGPV